MLVVRLGFHSNICNFAENCSFTKIIEPGHRQVDALKNLSMPNVIKPFGVCAIEHTTDVIVYANKAAQLHESG